MEFQIGNYDVIMMTGTNISDEVYCPNCIGCNVVCLLIDDMASGGVQGGVGIVVL